MINEKQPDKGRIHWDEWGRKWRTEIRPTEEGKSEGEEPQSKDAGQRSARC